MRRSGDSAAFATIGGQSNAIYQIVASLPPDISCAVVRKIAFLAQKRGLCGRSCAGVVRATPFRGLENENESASMWLPGRSMGGLQELDDLPLFFAGEEAAQAHVMADDFTFLRAVEVRRARDMTAIAVRVLNFEAVSFPRRRLSG